LKNQLISHQKVERKYCDGVSKTQIKEDDEIVKPKNIINKPIKK
jgi:hypothetical protein